MEHLKPFKEREVLLLEPVKARGWQLKRYAILADGRAFDAEVAAAATDEALKRLPKAGSLNDAAGNHGIGFQIVRFAEIAVVSPVFYWQWGSVLAQPFQIKAQWNEPTVFKDGVDEIVGCVWEMNIVRDEVKAWTQTMLGRSQNPLEQMSEYLKAGLEST
ncbi:MAG: hypothetical protein AAF919_10555 [Pseudomonadota bacterium]